MTIFFFFLMWNATTLLKLWERKHIMNKSLLNKEGFSSIHAVKSTMLWACLASRWVGLFLCQHTCENLTWRNSLHSVSMPAMSGSIDNGGLESSVRARYMIMESPSNMISQTPISLAKRSPVSKAFAYASNAPNGTSSILLRAASTLPSPSLIITPTGGATTRPWPPQNFKNLFYIMYKY